MDLETVGALHHLNNPVIIENVAKKLPGTFLRERYVNLKKTLQESGKSSLEVFTAFMDEERDW